MGDQQQPEQLPHRSARWQISVQRRPGHVVAPAGFLQQDRDEGASGCGEGLPRYEERSSRDTASGEEIVLIKALVFDFDGLIIDSETPVFETWRETFAKHGRELHASFWADVIGRPVSHFDLYAYVRENFD